MQPASASPAAAQEGKDNSPLKSWLLSLGVPAFVLTVGKFIWDLFLQGETIQKSGKAWLTGFRRKADTPAAASSDPSGGQALSSNDNQLLQQVSAGGSVTVASGDAEVRNESAGRDLVQRDQVQRDQYNAPANVTNAQTVNQYFAASEPQRERILSTIAPPPQGVGVMGREKELKDLEARMGEPGNNRRLVVHGEPGVGKSELLREYGRRHQTRYPGGRYWIDCRLNLAQEIASLGRQCWQMTWLVGPLEEQAMEVLRLIAKEKVLLLIDNAGDEAQVEPFLPPAGQAHVLLSSTSRNWGPPLVEVWRPEGLQRLDSPTAMAVLAKVAGAAVAEQVGETVIAELGGLPVHLLPTARSLARRARLGRLSEGALLQLSAEGIASFSTPWDVLDPAQRLLLQAAGRWFNPNALMEAELVAALADGFQGEVAVRDAVDGCRDLYLLQGEVRLTMHQLLVRFVDNQPLQRLGEFGTEDLGAMVAVALGKAAERLEEAPADEEALAALQCHQLSWDFWRRHPDGLNVDGCHHIGEALQVLGTFAEASHWFEAAATLIRREAELDHLALGDNLHEIGNCSYGQGQWTTAAGWFEQAVAEKRQGDLHGRVDHVSLGKSLNLLGMCAYQQDDLQAATAWYKQAAELQRWDEINGIADSLELAVNFHQLGNCALRQEDWQEAKDWYKKAVAAKLQRDQLDHADLGRSLYQLGMIAVLEEDWLHGASWYEKALVEARQGDQYGIQDHEAIAAILLELGNCAFQKREWSEAEARYEQASKEVVQGDPYQRVNHALLGRCLHMLGSCAFQQEEWQKATYLCEQAILEKRRGDVHERVDQESVVVSEESLVKCREKLDFA